MKIRLSELRRIIKEEVSRTVVTEDDESWRKDPMSQQDPATNFAAMLAGMKDEAVKLREKPYSEADFRYFEKGLKHAADELSNLKHKQGGEQKK